MSKFNTNIMEEFAIYNTSLEFNKQTLQTIINEIYSIENEKIYSSESGRTFKINKGFHSVNLMDPKYDIFSKYPHIKILCSRIQELLTNHFKTSKINWVDNEYGKLNIVEIWINILRITDYNIPHNHAHYDISGNFYLQTNKKKTCDTDGSLIFLSKNSHHYYLPQTVETSGSVPMIIPKPNQGIVFNSFHKHIVMPHFSDEDRIGVAFNARYDNTFNYDKIYPIPYWLPVYYNYKIKKEDIIQYPDKQIVKIKLKNGFKFNWTVNNMQNLVDEVIHLDKSQLEPLQPLATIDRSKYFININ